VGQRQELCPVIGVEQVESRLSSAFKLGNGCGGFGNQHLKKTQRSDFDVLQ